MDDSLFWNIGVQGSGGVCEERTDELYYQGEDAYVGAGWRPGWRMPSTAVTGVLARTQEHGSKDAACHLCQ